MENPMEQFIVGFLNPKEREALDIIYKGFDVDSLDMLESKILKKLFTKTKDEIAESKSNEFLIISKENFQLQNFEESDLNTDAIIENKHLPIRRTLEKVFRLLMINAAYQAKGLETTIEAIEQAQLAIVKALAIEGEQNPALDEMMEKLKSSLNVIDKKERLYDWPHSHQQLNQLAEFLFVNDYIDSEGKFIGCFKIELPELEDRVNWKVCITDLVFLSCLLWPQSEAHFILSHRFKKADKKLNSNNLRKIYNTIITEFEDDLYVIKKRKPILDFAKETFDSK
jgi:hypothetical protein